jgi:hypothetical protein
VFGGRSPVVALLEVLRRSPDEAPSEATAALQFISDSGAREDIRVDVANAHRALGNGEFKAATILAGSVLEALLLWAIRAADPERLAHALTKLVGGAPDGRGPEFWHLHDYVRVAQAMSMIDATTVTLVRLTADYRNLIHPGRVLRTGSRCDQSTALTALGAMERVITVLTDSTPGNIADSEDNRSV